MTPDIKVNGDKLVITVDVSAKAIAAAQPSKTGKTRIVSSTGGFAIIDGKNCKVALNVVTS